MEKSLLVDVDCCWRPLDKSTKQSLCILHSLTNFHKSFWCPINRGVENMYLQLVKWKSRILHGIVVGSAIFILITCLVVTRGVARARPFGAFSNKQFWRLYYEWRFSRQRALLVKKCRWRFIFAFKVPVQIVLITQSWYCNLENSGSLASKENRVAHTNKTRDNESECGLAKALTATTDIQQWSKMIGMYMIVICKTWMNLSQHFLCLL